WTVRRFEVLLDLLERKPRGPKLPFREELRLVEEMRRHGVAARTERVDRHGTHRGPELNDTDVGAAGYAVDPFLPWGWTGVRGEHRAVSSAHRRERKTGTIVTEGLRRAFVITLHPAHFAPGNLPGPEAVLE